MFQIESTQCFKVGAPSEKSFELRDTYDAEVAPKAAFTVFDERSLFRV